ncbi:Coiled-coil domain-containing protein 87 [Rhizoclosmatium hyalinum]|nr:Coiled-coil domain-containing protein 87 [Rhizoclosmatium hyalinum]
MDEKTFPAAPPANPKLTIRNGVFEVWELEEKALSMAIASAEKTHSIRQQIWKGTKNALDSVIHPVPKLELPKISLKGQQTSVRHKLLMENTNQGKQEIFNFSGRFNKNTQSRNTPLSVTHREEMFLINDMEAIVAKNSLQIQTGSIGDESIETKPEDPLLQAHTSSTKLVKRQRLGFSIGPSPPDDENERYLPENKLREIHLKGFEYTILDDPTLESKADSCVYQKQKMPDLTISRTMESRVSMRIPKGFINLAAEPASAVSQFGNEVDTKKIDILDEKLSRYKEIEELYSEITKTLTSNHLETDDDEVEDEKATKQKENRETEEIKKLKLQRVKSDTDITTAQQQLENLWVALKMPLDQKLDMAIKYGSRKFGGRLELAIKYWKKASDLILSREQILRDIEAFECEASDPDRYFRKGYDGSSEARMQEAKTRDGHLQVLHKMEEQIADIIAMIKFELNETVTYHGIPYTEKMKSDYGDILRHFQKQKPLTPIPSLPPLPTLEEEP